MHQWAMRRLILLQQILRPQRAEAYEIGVPRPPSRGREVPRLDGRPQLRSRGEPVKTLRAELELRRMRRADGDKERDGELRGIVPGPVSHVDSHPVQGAARVFPVRGP